jgi:hypothetical protein
MAADTSAGIFMTTRVSSSLFPSIMLTEVSLLSAKSRPSSFKRCPSTTSFASLQQLKQREYLQKQHELLEREKIHYKRSLSPSKHRTPLLTFTTTNKTTPGEHSKENSTKKSFHNYFLKHEPRKQQITTILTTTAYDVLPSTTWMNCSNSSLSIGIIGKNTTFHSKRITDSDSTLTSINF